MGRPTPTCPCSGRQSRRPNIPADQWEQYRPRFHGLARCTRQTEPTSKPFHPIQSATPAFRSNGKIDPPDGPSTMSANRSSLVRLGRDHDPSLPRSQECPPPRQKAGEHVYLSRVLYQSANTELSVSIGMKGITHFETVSKLLWNASPA